MPMWGMINEEKYRVWAAGGHILAITTKDDAELIVRALNRDELFEEVAVEFKEAKRICCACNCFFFDDTYHTEECWRWAILLTKIEALQKGEAP